MDFLVGRIDIARLSVTIDEAERNTMGSAAALAPVSVAAVDERTVLGPVQAARRAPRPGEPAAGAAALAHQSTP
ncbi:hypothetical protein Ga0074812_108189 [Parafrankia irregularis]|uniref:Uncharacterized protein n=1 Tax=Parafrankia irregularis TaxID=795642 RepID=A0A0S4QLX2_9ACTN|nr:hypothetical protein [Parafrankia irregularis]MBE3200147.1 hypothetical protein [Parafrankia sp. CH37]CUU56661.1 hypothetical protein Ga0074812_108189 [Parafrankia irregularis]